MSGVMEDLWSTAHVGVSTVYSVSFIMPIARYAKLSFGVVIVAPFGRH